MFVITVQCIRAVWVFVFKIILFDRYVRNMGEVLLRTITVLSKGVH